MGMRDPASKKLVMSIKRENKTYISFQIQICYFRDDFLDSLGCNRVELSNGGGHSKCEEDLKALVVFQVRPDQLLYP